MTRALFIILFALATYTPVLAHGSTLVELEHYQAKHLVSAGKILSLDVTLSKIKYFCYGKLIDAHLYQEQGKWRYDLQIKAQRGQIIDLSLDASTGQPNPTKSLPSGCRAFEN
ncbi:hypothetical protein FM037_03760 [Shewanella psychropiezotolerans]|uniref:PepSY domain-containing protein n=1 Tax=Shewanella psychropiezotolerans TaxID=2593655 RepID=A0ABX5WVV0_9GAMM|nr:MULTISPECIES: hypothetical protein [Shewanella]MPY25243.1 hypothetical protein [Shewanella sp. YLB-07]QDO82517.1 hypothetical protein FM037_03760 [Shewanella psychropiezotolerans]